MAGANNTGEIISSVALVSLPTVEIPKDFQQDKYGCLSFQIATTEGDVQVLACRRACSCKGTAGALAACGLLQTDWLPGISENNKVRQCIAFDKGHAIPLRGQRKGVKNPALSLTITRRSRIRYEVRVPQTKAQQEFVHGIIDKQIDEERRERKVEEEKAAAASKPKSPGEFRDDWLQMVEMAMSLNHRRAENCGFSFNKESASRIDRIFSELCRSIAEGGVQATPILHRDGNVIYLGAAATNCAARKT